LIFVFCFDLAVLELPLNLNHKKITVHILIQIQSDTSQTTGGYTSDNVFCFPRFSCNPNLSTAVLRIINNDTGEEMERSFGERNIPLIYRRNKRGYTFICQVRSLDQALPAGKWRLRLVGNGGEPVLQTATKQSELTSIFGVNERQDYYVPNPKNCVLRQLIKVQDNHLTTMFMRLSKMDLECQLKILDKNKALFVPL